MVGLSWAPASSVSIFSSENHPPAIPPVSEYTQLITKYWVMKKEWTQHYFIGHSEDVV